MLRPAKFYDVPGQMVAQVGFKPTEWRIQSPLPYRLATGQYNERLKTTPSLTDPIPQLLVGKDKAIYTFIKWCRWGDLNPHEPKPNGFSYYSILLWPSCDVVVWNMSSPYVLSTLRWLVYVLYTFTVKTPIFTDLARRCPSRIFAELANIHSGSFLSWCSSCK